MVPAPASTTPNNMVPTTKGSTPKMYFVFFLIHHIYFFPISNILLMKVLELSPRTVFKGQQFQAGKNIKCSQTQDKVCIVI